MARNIGKVEFLVGADGKILKRELLRAGRQAARVAGRQTAKDFNKAFDGQLTVDAGRALGGWRTKMRHQGRHAGLLTGEAFTNATLGVLRRRAREAQREMAEAFTFKGDDALNKFARRFDTASAAISRMEENLRIVRREGHLTDDQFERLNERVKTWGATLIKNEEELNRNRDAIRATRREMILIDDQLTKGGWDDLRREVGGTSNAFDRLHSRIKQVEKDGGDFAWVTRATRRLFTLRDASESSSSSIDRGGRRMRRAEGHANALSRAMGRLGRRFRNIGNRGDLTPRSIALIITTLGESISTLASGAAASLTAMLSSVAVAVGGLVVLLAPALASIVAGVGLAVNSFRFMKEEVPAVGDALTKLGNVAEASGRRFAQAWGPSVATFLDTLSEVLANTKIIDAFAAAFTRVTDAFTNVLNSPVFGAFEEQLGTNLPEAFGKLGEAAANIFSGLIGLATAAAPYFNELMGAFNEWSAQWADRMANLGSDSGFHDFMNTAIESLKTILSFLDSVGEFMGTVFMAGAESGNRLFQSLEQVFRGWTDWLNTVEGQNALEEWFANGETILRAFGDLLVDTGKMFADLVTPESIARLTEFMDRLGDLMPGLGDIIKLFGELDILNLVAVALETVGAFLQPLMPLLHDFAAILGSTLKDALASIQPALTTLGAALAPLIPVVGALIAEYLPPFAESLGRIITALSPIIELIVELASAVLPTLFDVLETAVGYIADFLEAIFGAEVGSDEFKQTIQIVGDVVRTIFETIGNVVGVVMDFMGGSFKVIASLLRGDFSGAFKAMYDVVKDVFARFGVNIDDVIEWVGDLWTNVSNFFGKIGKAISDFGKTVADIFDGVISWIRDAINWFGSLFGAANNASSAVRGARGSGAGVGGAGPARAASGALLTRATQVLAGEDGPEAIVPLRRPLNRVDPSVRWLSAVAQGKTPHMAAGGVVGGGVTVEAGAISITAPDPWKAALETVNRITEMAVN